MRIVHIAAEMAPFAKVGGLGDMVSGLTKELASRNETVEMVLPRYNFIKLDGLSVERSKFKSFFNNSWIENFALTTVVDKVKLILIEPPKEIDFFLRPNIYGYEDDPNRFSYFSRAALDYLLSQKKSIDILHIHDWHTSLCAVLFKDHFKKLGLQIKKTVLNIHNVEYQGICESSTLDSVGLESSKYSLADLLVPAWLTSKLNLLKGGINYSDAIVAVSPSYAEEILTEKYGYGLQEVLLKNKDKISGILNGIDTDIWNPQTDAHIKFHFDSTMNFETILEQKKKNKELLQQFLGLNISEKPIVSSIGRLVPQKGPELIKEAINITSENKGQFILLGSSTIKNIQEEFSELSNKFKQNKDISINFAFDEHLAHLIYAASDYLIIPSLFEPCGLTQLIALRYGSIPIVRKTGGLKDSVFDLDDPSFSNKIVNGFSFSNFDKNELSATLIRALNYFYSDRKKINRLIENGMAQNYSLASTGKEYLSLYKKLLNS